MSKKHGLYVNSVIQRAFLSVSEGGTEVSASNFGKTLDFKQKTFLVKIEMLIFLKSGSSSSHTKIPGSIYSRSTLYYFFAW